MRRWRLNSLHVLSVVALVVVLSACGGNDDDSAQQPVTTTVQATDAAAAENPNTLPAELVGTYESQRKGDDFPAGLWKLAIGPQGEFFIVPPGETGFFNSPLTIRDKMLVVPQHNESGCTSVGKYTYTVKGDGPGGSLTLKAAEDTCETRASLLSASWKMTD